MLRLTLSDGTFGPRLDIAQEGLNVRSGGFCTVALVAGCVGSLWAVSQTVNTSSLPAYAKTPAGVVAKVLPIGGASEADALLRKWGGIFLRTFGQAKMEIQVSDSVQALGYMADRPDCIGMMGRPATDAEVKALEGEGDVRLVGLRVAADFVVVCVHKDNPLAQRGITLESLDGVFSKTHKRGGSGDVAHWSQLGLTGEWADKPIKVYSCAKASSVTEFFVQSVLDGGTFKDGVQYTVRDGETADVVSSNRYAIGFSSLRFCGAAAALVPVARAKEPAVQPVSENAASYPLVRYLHAYVPLRQGQELDGNRREFLKIALSTEGQTIASGTGYVPVSFEFAKDELAKIGVAIAPAAVKTTR